MSRRASPLREAATAARGARFLRFLVVGASNTAISFVTYLVAHALLPAAAGRASAAQAVAYAAGIAWSYAWNRAWVFGSRDRMLGEGARFLASQLGLMVLSVAAIGVAVDGFGAHHVWAWLVVMALVTVLNYLSLRFWAFRRA